MTKRALPFLIFAVMIATGFRSASTAMAAPPSNCVIDTSSSNYTLNRIEDRLDPADTTAFGAGFRTANGLNGVSFAGISIIDDSATCAAGIRAYARITFPTDSIARNNFLSAVDNIFIVRLSANRFVLNANFYSPQRLIEHLLVDSAFSRINVNF